MDGPLAEHIGKAGRAVCEALLLSIAHGIELEPEFYARPERGTAMPSVETLVALTRPLGSRQNEERAG
jgi:hypothetical protein